MNYYLKDVKVGDPLFSEIYGFGTAFIVLDKDKRVDGFYSIGVEFKGNNKVYYTMDGVPDWLGKGATKQTLFLPKDVDISKYDFEPLEVVLTPGDIHEKLKNDNLEVRCPSGIWKKIRDCPSNLVKDIKRGLKFHRFRDQK